MPLALRKETVMDQTELEFAGRLPKPKAGSKLIVIGNGESALAIIEWLKQHYPQCDVRSCLAFDRPTVEAAIKAAKEPRVILTILDTAIELYSGIKLDNYQVCPAADRKGIWLLRKILPSPTCRRRVILATFNRERVKEFCAEHNIPIKIGRASCRERV